MTYSAKSNPNATNSELDSKRIITHKELTSSQRDELTSQFAELVADNMDIKDLVRYAIDGMIEYFCEEFIFECDDLDALDRYHDDNYLTINWGLN